MADEDGILTSWQANAESWLSAVREQRIASRRVTDAAILDAIRAGRPRRVLDVGCGEGWLCRALHEEGIEAVGVDATDTLIDAARAAGAGRFEVLRYDELARDPLQLGQFDAVVFNSALFEADPGLILRTLVPAVHPSGRLLIQTVHPDRIAGEAGWREERFADFGALFPAVMPWYFHPLAGWDRLLEASGWTVLERREPRACSGGLPCSLILIARS